MTDMTDVVRRLERLEAYQEISNLMGRMEFYHSAYRNDLIPPLFADRDDVVVEMPFGTFLGRDAAERCWNGAMTEDVPPRDLTGEYVDHLLTTPVIEVARDGQTAKGSWISPGAEAHHLGWLEGNPLHGFWYWCRYHAEFVHQDGVWKLWRLNVSETFVADFYGSWAEPEKGLPHPPSPPAIDAPPRRQATYSPTWDPRSLELGPEPYGAHPDA